MNDEAHKKAVDLVEKNLRQAMSKVARHGEAEEQADAKPMQILSPVLSPEGTDK